MFPFVSAFPLIVKYCPNIGKPPSLSGYVKSTNARISFVSPGFPTTVLLALMCVIVDAVAWEGGVDGVVVPPLPVFSVGSSAKTLTV